MGALTRIFLLGDRKQGLPKSRSRATPTTQVP